MTELQPPAPGADTRRAVIDQRLLDHWRHERRARERARSSVPAAWRTDPRLAEIREAYVEGLVEMRRVRPPASSR